ncbi:MAG: protein-L-isoaspartate(D-aspartate) O-methyltransferase [Candidatus Sulfotelmatobacter sp.]|jgi:protein-L-isoaspartate(D-aspartate) O-methyltransferase
MSDSMFDSAFDPTIARQVMVDSQLRARGISDARVLDAMLRVPRHLFVPEAQRACAYEDHPLPIGESQTISQPYVVALMLESLQLTATDKVLEVGTGSGYVTALLAEIAAQVFSIERHPALADSARDVLAALGYTNIQVFTGDGTLGLSAAAPFDAILVSAAAPAVPPAPLTQLREGGRMIIPVGYTDDQQLQFIRMINGQPVVQSRESVRFVPLIPGKC